LREIRSPSFSSGAELEMMGHTDAVRVSNPLAAEEAFLRTSLVPGLLRGLGRNLSRQVRSAALFEVGTVFRAADPVEERQVAALAMTGPASHGWTEEEREMDFFDAKGALEGLLDGLGVEEWELGSPLSEPFHPARSAQLVIDGQLAGALGEIHPKIAERFDLPGRVAVAEVDLAELASAGAPLVSYCEIPRLPPVRRDLAFVLDVTTPAAAVLGALEEVAGAFLQEAVLFDVFAGGPIPAGKKSLAFSVDLRAPGRTMTDEEADGVVRAVVERLRADFGAELRAG